MDISDEKRNLQINVQIWRERNTERKRERQIGSEIIHKDLKRSSQILPIDDKYQINLYSFESRATLACLINVRQVYIIFPVQYYQKRAFTSLPIFSRYLL